MRPNWNPRFGAFSSSLWLARVSSTVGLPVAVILFCTTSPEAQPPSSFIDNCIPLFLRLERPGFITGITAASKLPPGAPGIALGLFLQRGGKRITPKHPWTHEFRPGTRGVPWVPDFSLFWLVPFAPFAEVIFEIVNSVASKRLLALVPSKLYRFGLCLFHDLPSYPVCLVAQALNAFDYIEQRDSEVHGAFLASAHLGA